MVETDGIYARVYCDGNKEEFAFFCAKCDEVVSSKVGVEDGDTHNRNEYRAIINALYHIINNHSNSPISFEVVSDSQLAIEQLNHNYTINDTALRDLANQAWEVNKIAHAKFKWIRRELNKAGKYLG